LRYTILDHCVLLYYVVHVPRQKPRPRIELTVTIENLRNRRLNCPVTEMYTSGVHSNNLSQKLEPTEPSFLYNNYYNQMRQTCDREINPSLIRILTGRSYIVTIIPGLICRLN